MQVAIYIYNVTTKETFDCRLLFTEALCGCKGAQSECSHYTLSVNKCPETLLLQVRRVHCTGLLNSTFEP